MRNQRKPTYLIGVVFLILYWGQIQCTGTEKVRAELPENQHKIVVIAHRGNHVNIPENTLEAYEAAITGGADYVEIDLRMTADSQLVILHDETTDKMTGVSGKISELIFAEVRNLEIRPKIESDTNTYRIPDFESVLAVCRGKINIYLDFKEADITRTYKMIREAGMENQIVVYLNSEDQYAEWKRLAPDIPLMTSHPEEMDPDEMKEWISRYDLKVVDNAYSKEKIAILHEMGVSVWLDVQGSGEGPDRWEEALTMKPDGLQTGQPDDLIDYLKKKGIR